MYTLTSRIGSFIFSKETYLSHAKLIRDTVVGQWFNPRQGTPALNTVYDVHAFMLDHQSKVLSGVSFQFVPR